MLLAILKLIADLRHVWNGFNVRAKAHRFFRLLIIWYFNDSRPKLLSFLPTSIVWYRLVWPGLELIL